MVILGDVTPAIQRISIDEAFLDVSGSTHLFGSPATIARNLRRRVRLEVGLPISVGAARTKHLAKVASQVAKPDGLVVVETEDELAFLDPLPVSLMWGVGPVAERRLAELGIHTIGDLARTPTRALERLLGHAVGGETKRARPQRTTRGASAPAGGHDRSARSRPSGAAARRPNSSARS
jgi:DNA polymerase-4